jgi:hypothetical protein
MSERYEVDGVDLTTLVHSVQVIDGFVGVPRPLHDEITVPGRWGAIATKPYFDKRTITLGVVLRGSSRADYLANVKEFARTIVNNGRTFTLTRVHDVEGEGEQRVDATARYVSGFETVQQIAPNSGRVSVELVLLDGFWKSQSYHDTGLTGASLFAIDVPGEMQTPYVEVIFSGGASVQRLTNLDSGAYVEWTGNSASPVTVDVEAFTVKQNANVVLANFDYDNPDGDRYWFMLGPGANQMELSSSGSVQIKYKGAFI